MIFRKKHTNNFCVPVAYVNGYIITEAGDRIELQKFIVGWDAIVDKEKLKSAAQLLELPILIKPDIAQIMSRKEPALVQFLKNEFEKELDYFSRNIDQLSDSSEYDSIHARFQAKEIEEIIKGDRIPPYLKSIKEEISTLSFPVEEEFADEEKLNQYHKKIKGDSE